MPAKISPHGLLIGVVLAAFAGSVQAEACTYREAIMALEQGNTVRGLALLRMASRDGDPRAKRQLAGLQTQEPRKPDADTSLLALGNTLPEKQTSP